MAVPADWYLDPTSRNERRYWDGARWTDRVMDAAGNESRDPVTSGREAVDLTDWARQDAMPRNTTSQVDKAPARDPRGSSPPDDRHKVVIGSSMVRGSLFLGLVSLIVALNPLFGPVGVIGGLVAVWFALLGRRLIRGAGDLEVAGPTRNVLVGILAASVGTISTALLLAMMRNGDVASFVVCLSETTETTQCLLDFGRAAVRSLGW